MKSIFSLIIAVCTVAALQTAALATGFVNDGGYTSSKVEFGLETGDTVVVYNGDVYTDPDYDNIWPGSDIYIPLYMIPEDGEASQATDKDLKSNEVTLSWKAARGRDYIDDITLEDGKKAKVDGLDGGIYAKIAINREFTGRIYAGVEAGMSLSVKKIAYPESLTTLEMSLVNREVEIDRDMVYAAFSPTEFYAIKQYGGAATFDFGDKVQYSAKVEKGTRYHLQLDRTENTAVRENYPDASLEFYNFLGDRDTFASAGTLEIPITRSKFTPKGQSKAQVFVYEVSGNNLTALDERVLTFEAKSNILSIRTKTLGNYILSDSPLSKTVETTEDNIIYTGYDTGNLDSQSTGDINENPDMGGDDDVIYTGSGDSDRQSTGGVNENPDMGGDGDIIYADNPRANNPLTSDTPYRPLIPLALTTGLAAFAMWKNGWHLNRSGR